MKLIITGATGFVGRNLVSGLRADGHEVVATGRSPTVGDALRLEGVEFHGADLRDEAQVGGAFQPADCVIHCGGKSGPWESHRQHFEANVLGTRHVVSACRRHGIERLVFVSTPSVYFTGRDRIDVAEDEPLPRRQVTSYARTKLTAERELEKLRGEALRVITLRPRAVYGPFDTTFIPRILRMAKARRFRLVDGGRALTDVTYVGNLVDAVRACLDAPDSAWHHVYNLSNGEPLSVREWFAGVVEAFGRPFVPKEVPRALARLAATVMEISSHLPLAGRKPAMTRASVDYLATTMTLSIAKARDRLGYAPRVTNHDGFRMTADWFRERGLAGDVPAPRGRPARAPE